MRSLTELRKRDEIRLFPVYAILFLPHPQGSMDSSFNKILAPKPSDNFVQRTIGVRPMRSVTEE
jgi:hypothetical protein